MSAETSSQIFEYESIARVLFGLYACKQTGAEARNLTEGKNALVVTDSGVAKAGLLDEIETSLAVEGFTVTICANVVSEPTVSDFESVLEKARNNNPDVLIGVGGGSSLDVAKVVARGLTNIGPLENYVGENWSSAGIPLITIPTTAGTAAEVTPDAVVRLPDEKVKSGFIDVCSIMDTFCILPNFFFIHHTILQKNPEIVGFWEMSNIIKYLLCMI